MGVGGRASCNGITFTDTDRRVRTGEHGSAELRPVPKWQRAARKKLSRIPLLRGLTLFLHPGMGLVLAALAVNDALTLAGVYWGGGVTDTVLLAAAAAALLVLVIVRRKKGGGFGAVRRYHAAEHMAINVYEVGTPVTAENVAAAERTHPRCGTNLVVIMLPLSVPVALFCPYALELVPVVCVAYEVFLALPKKRWLKPLLAVCLWVQRHITTAAPGAREIEAAVRGMKRLAEGDTTSKRAA